MRAPALPERTAAGGHVRPPAEDDADVAALIDALLAKAEAQTVEVDAGLVERVAARVVRRAAQGVPEVVAFPASAKRIIEVSKRDDGDVNPLVQVISQDAAVTASLITIANSAASGASAPITNARDAVLRLGAVDAARAALAVALRGVSAGKGGAASSALRGQLFVDSLADGFTASWLADALRCPGAERAFIVTMVRELTRPVVLTLLESDLPDDAARLSPPETLAVIDAAAPLVARVLAEALQLPDGLAEALVPPATGTSPLAHVGRLAAALGALLRHAPRPSTWAAQAHGSALILELGVAMTRATITQRVEDGVLAQRLASTK